MPHPTQKRTKSSKKRRASHFALKTVKLFACKNCQAKIIAHRACPKCGYYKGREVVKKTTKKKKTSQKK